jgi:hypothetical protein
VSSNGGGGTVSDRQEIAVANGDGSRMRKRLRGGEVTRIGRHVQRRASVQEPLSRLGAAGWNARCSERGEKSPVVPNVAG